MAIGIELVHIYKTYPNGFTAVEDVNLDIHPGEFLCLLGPSGCGKTTTLRMIAGLETPTSGEIRFDGKRVDHVPVNKRNTSMVFQNYALFPHKTVFENIAFGLRMRGVGKREIRERVLKFMEMTSISQLGDRYPHQLSGGQQQRVALARALVCEPDALLLDEPLSALDKKLRDQMRFELKKIQQNVGITTVFVTHDQEEALALSDRICIMDHGRIVQIGTPKELYERPVNEYVANFLGTSNVFSGVFAIEDGRPVIVTGNGSKIAVRDFASLGERMTVSFRPEAVRLERRSPDDIEIVAKLEDVSYLGSRIRFVYFWGGQWIVAETLNQSGRPAWEKEQTVRLYISPDDLVRLA